MHYSKDLITIAETCRDLERSGQDLFTSFALRTEDPVMKEFWSDVSNDEKEHVRFWEDLLSMLENNSIPEFPYFEDETLRELSLCNARVKQLIKNSRSISDPRKMLMSALELEFIMLHPAFEILFHFTASFNGDITPEDRYEFHLSKFIDMSGRQKTIDRNLKLISEMLLNIWRKNKRLAQLSSTDELTAVLNRRGFLAAAKSMANIAQRNNLNVAVMFIDLDKFKAINDTYGHEQGDEVLKKVAAIIWANLRKSDLIGRYGGDEFILLLTDIQPDFLYSLAEKIRISVKDEHGFAFPVTISIGASQAKISTKIDKDLFSLIQAADRFMYNAKSFGTNRVCMDYLG